MIIKSSVFLIAYRYLRCGKSKLKNRLYTLSKKSLQCLDNNANKKPTGYLYGSACFAFIIIFNCESA